MEPTFGGINLEDIKAPECFIIEQRAARAHEHPGLARRPARHRDHRAAGLINAAVSSPGAHQGRQGRGQRRRRRGHRLHRADQGDGRAHENVTMCDRKGVIYRGRTEGMDQWKSAHAIDTDARTLAEALKGATCSSACRPRAR
jgi:malate dehydrogenase (oxaloacetate-decarboxylating)(NADP+)